MRGTSDLGSSACPARPWRLGMDDESEETQGYTEKGVDCVLGGRGLHSSTFQLNLSRF